MVAKKTAKNVSKLWAYEIRQDASKPFLLYFASLAPHAPYEAPQDYIDRYTTITDDKRRAYAAMITVLDEQVGRMVAAPERRGLRDNTLILLTSDNGGARTGRARVSKGGQHVPRRLGLGRQRALAVEQTPRRALRRHPQPDGHFLA
jgi:arylsulfatase A-like enzyme